jgi:hypothetical protein
MPNPGRTPNPNGSSHDIDDTKQAAFIGTIQNVSYLLLWLVRCLNTAVCFVLLLMGVVALVQLFMSSKALQPERQSAAALALALA